ncbi:hypothetical protein K1T71_012376 [Dendrolimus kikuchii]|uniref:Uncharacterized protein n=1 Tax=Dendrolimus kikuchii TaxID=765133 RepID=A0ACC1CLE1_9NEOP|nr:hypothetical protein K1T71_012376 [Dendrolimus kikuchii]
MQAKFEEAVPPVGHIPAVESDSVREVQTADVLDRSEEVVPDRDTNIEIVCAREEGGNRLEDVFILLRTVQITRTKMRWRGRHTRMQTTRTILAVFMITISACEAARRSHRRKDISRAPDLYEPSPSAESLTAIAQAMGAAEFEHYTEGRPLVKRLIPADSQPDLDVVEHQGVIGRAGVDFPAYPNIPTTGFNCKNVPTGYYADLETDCQVFHICDTSRKISFLCPNGTIFSQSHLICDWWFKVDCASAPALYESSAEYYSNEQKKSQKPHQNFRNQDLQYIGDSNIRAESRRASVNIPSTTERLQRHRQRLQTDTPFNIQGAARSYQTFIEFQPTQRSQATTAFERRKNLVQLITNTFVIPRPTPATVPEAPRREDTNINEMQVAAETASFANNNNRQYLQDFHNKNYRPYPVYTPNTLRSKPKPSPNLTTLYDIRDKQAVEPSESTHKQTSQEAPESIKELNKAQDKSVRLFTPNTQNLNNYLVHIPKESNKQRKQETEHATKRPSLVQYTKSYSTIVINNPDPYTRPGVSALKRFLEREKNNTLISTTEAITQATEKADNNKLAKSIETTEKFESVTKIPEVTRGKVYFTEATEPSRVTQTTADPSYKERREKLLKKLNSNENTPSEETTPTFINKFKSDQPPRPGLVVPPSLTPKTLHSLAIYYATALDNLSTTPSPENIETTTASSIDEYEFMEEALPALFSKQTLNEYSNLFKHTTDHEALIEQMKLEANGTYNDLSEDLSTQQSQNPLATSPQIRELAQVFTHALSAYLQDPVQFRKVLSDIRPTHPSFGDLLSTTEDPFTTEPTTTVNEEDDEILGFSDDHKTNNLQNLREAKALSTSTNYPEVQTTYSTETVYPTYSTTTRNPFRCCGRISASYTSPSTPYTTTTTTPSSYTVASTNYFGNSDSTTYYSVPRYGGFQNNAINNNEYGKDTSNAEGKPLSQYEEVTNLPTAWGVDITRSTPTPDFESKKIRTSTYIPTTTPLYFTETDSVELENEEELQRAHSQSFLPPQSNSLRHGKQLNIEQTSTTAKTPSEDLEAPTTPDIEITTAQTTTQFTTIKNEEPDFTTTTLAPTSLFTSSDSDRTTIEEWQTPYEDWPSTIIDPITLNDNLSPIDSENNEEEKESSTYVSTAATEFVTTTEQTYSSTTNIPVATDSNTGDRTGRLLRDFSTEPAQDLSAITDTVVEKAKEIMGGMNSTTTEKLMNVMKKTKSKTVKRLILLLVQTCDDDHNATAEASKRALLEALMAVSQKDMDEIAKESGTEFPTTAEDYDYRTSDYVRRMDHRPRHFDRRGKSIRVEASAVNSLSNGVTESTKTNDQETVSTTAVPITTSRRGVKKYKITPTDILVTKAPLEVDRPVAEARSASKDDLKTAADTRALELLRSLYSIAARWG